jgi:hypothetical protein
MLESARRVAQRLLREPRVGRVVVGALQGRSRSNWEIYPCAPGASSPVTRHHHML